MNQKCQTVLIVDDEEDLTWSISRRLGKAWDHIHIMCANSGKEALELMNKQTVDLLITDIRMPEMDGYQLVQHVKENFPQTRIVFMSAYGSTHREEFETLKVESFLEKPFEMDTLKRLITKLLNHFRDDSLEEIEIFQKSKLPEKFAW